MTDQNMPAYGFDQETPETTSAPVLPDGIHSNVKLTAVAYQPAKEGSDNYCLAFTFKDDKGRELRHTEWPIDPAMVEKQAISDGKDPNKEISKRMQSQGIRIKHIVTKVVPKERAVVPKVTSFQQYANAIVNLLKPALPSGPLHAKVLINNRGYSEFPGYTPFLEKQVEGEDTVLEISPRERARINQNKSKSEDLDMPGGAPESDISDDDAPF